MKGATAFVAVASLLATFALVPTRSADTHEQSAVKEAVRDTIRSGTVSAQTIYSLDGANWPER